MCVYVFFTAYKFIVSRVISVCTLIISPVKIGYSRDIMYMYMYLQSFTEKGYEHMSVSTHTVSYWTWVAMVNSVGTTFYNDLYDPALYPRCVVMEVLIFVS